MTAKKPFYITTAISYPNGPPHIGHAYEVIAGDVLARFQRLHGVKTRFQTGTDEHGQKMCQAAEKEGIAPQQLADRLAPLFQNMAEKLHCSHDVFIRTTQPRNKKAAIALWQRMAATGDIYKGSYKGWYAVRDEAFYTQSELVDNAAGHKVAPSGAPVKLVEEESYFFRLSSYQDKLLQWYEDHKDFIAPKERYNEVAQFVRSGLQDISISRVSYDWGVPVPEDEKHVMYVWVDALVNYLAGLGFPEKTQEMTDWWPCDLHLIGKDITRFHGVYWPAFLMSAGLALPRRIFAHGFLTVRGEKMSKSVGNVLDPMALATQYGADSLRYFLLRDVPFGSDGSYSHEAITRRHNGDLANDLGNLMQRTLTLTHRHCGAKVPTPNTLQSQDTTLLAGVRQLLERADQHLNHQEIHLYLVAVWEQIAMVNRYVAHTQPWALAKTDTPRMATVLYTVLECLRHITLITQPVMPHSMEQALTMLGVEASARDFSYWGEKGKFVGGESLPKPWPLFPRHTAQESQESA